MAKRPYTINDLTEILDDEFQWRRKELFLFKSKIPLEISSIQKAYLRAGITMLYAHIEGFVKNMSTYYLQFISYKYLKHNELKSPLLATCLKNKLVNTNNIERQVDLIDFFFIDVNTKANLPYKNIINTRSNLNFQVFEEILYTIGIDIIKFEKREEILNDLVSLRNTIAHGEYKDIDYETYIGFYNEIESLMGEYKTEIENNAVLENYKRNMPVANIV